MDVHCPCIQDYWVSTLKDLILFLRISHKFHPCQDCCNHDVSQPERGPILSLQNSRNSLVTRPLNMWYPPHHESCLLWGNLPATTFFRKIIRPLSAADGDGMMRKCLFCFSSFDKVTIPMPKGNLQVSRKSCLQNFGRPDFWIKWSQVTQIDQNGPRYKPGRLKVVQKSSFSISP